MPAVAEGLRQVDRDLGRSQLRQERGMADEQDPHPADLARRSAGVASRVSTVSPSTSRSIRVRRKQSSASAGVLTIGSVSFKEVLSTIGTPVRSSKARMSRQ